MPLLLMNATALSMHTFISMSRTNFKLAWQIVTSLIYLKASSVPKECPNSSLLKVMSQKQCPKVMKFVRSILVRTGGFTFFIVQNWNLHLAATLCSPHLLNFSVMRMPNNDSSKLISQKNKSTFAQNCNYLIQFNLHFKPVR